MRAFRTSGGNVISYKKPHKRLTFAYILGKLSLELSLEPFPYSFWQMETVQKATV